MPAATVRGTPSALTSANIALFLTLCATFLILNRGAYKGYFQDDELDNVSWAPYAPLPTWTKGIVSPRFDPDNFRPTGHFYFRIAAQRFGLDFPKYLIPVHVLHLLNAGLVWFLARRLRAGPVAAWTAAIFFTLNVAAFDAYWKPMYVFDVLCAFFCLGSVLLFAHRRWVLSLIAFWLAYKSKELAVMLPAVLAAYEYWFGERRWRPLIPFFLISLSFGVQGIVLNPHKDDDYTFRFAFQSLEKTIPFYSSRLLLIPYGGIAILLLALLRDRRIWFGLAAMCLFLFPLIFLPGRLFPAYCYLPLTGVAIALAGLVSIGEGRHWRPMVAVLLATLAIWIPWNIRELRIDRRATLAADDGARGFVNAIQDYAKTHPNPQTMVYDSVPPGLHHWGVTAALNIAYHRLQMQALFVDSPQAREALLKDSVFLMSWDEGKRRAHFTTQGRELSYIVMGRETPLWQLVSGWLGIDGYFQWIQPEATAYLWRPLEARNFEVIANISPELIRKLGSTHLEVRLNGVTVGRKEFTSPGRQTVAWPIPEGASGKTRVDFLISPEFQAASDNRKLGIAIVAFGFLGRE